MQRYNLFFELPNFFCIFIEEKCDYFWRRDVRKKREAERFCFSLPIFSLRMNIFAFNIIYLKYCL